ncbi:ABC transporter substrate-binding protein, partial [Candidatus Parcubacteria bacterium]|nr:ABC transporter substrate-binding protein [Candidatus Parcubacteria bacterium]
SEQTDFSQGQKTIFNHEFQKLGGSIMVDEDFAKEAKDFRTILLKIKVAGPDAIIINAQSAATGGTFIKQLSELNLTYPLYGTMPLASQDALIIAGPAAEGMVIITTPDLNKNNKQTTDFLTRYRKIYGDPSYEIVVAAAYDNVYLLKEAIEAVGLDTDKIRDYLYDLRDYHGLIGTYGFDKNGDVENIKFVAKYVKNGEVVSTK